MVSNKNFWQLQIFINQQFLDLNIFSAKSVVGFFQPPSQTRKKTAAIIIEINPLVQVWFLEYITSEHSHLKQFSQKKMHILR